MRGAVAVIAASPPPARGPGRGGGARGPWPACRAVRTGPPSVQAGQPQRGPAAGAGDDHRPTQCGEHGGGLVGVPARPSRATSARRSRPRHGTGPLVARGRSRWPLRRAAAEASGRYAARPAPPRGTPLPVGLLGVEEEPLVEPSHVHQGARRARGAPRRSRTPSPGKSGPGPRPRPTPATASGRASTPATGCRIPVGAGPGPRRRPAARRAGRPRSASIASGPMTASGLSRSTSTPESGSCRSPRFTARGEPEVLPGIEVRGSGSWLRPPVWPATTNCPPPPPGTRRPGPRGTWRGRRGPRRPPRPRAPAGPGPRRRRRPRSSPCARWPGGSSVAAHDARPAGER